MRAIRKTTMPVEVLWDYRELKRDEVHVSAMLLRYDHSIDDISELVKSNDFQPIELSVVKDRALLTDGSQRILAAKQLGLETIEVNITVHFNEGSEMYYAQTLDRSKPIAQTLETQLKRIFL